MCVPAAENLSQGQGQHGFMVLPGNEMKNLMDSVVTFQLESTWRAVALPQQLGLSRS